MNLAALMRLTAAVAASVVLAGCTDREIQPVEAGLVVKPGLWRTVTAARVPPNHPHMRSMPTTGQICVGGEGRGAIPYVEDNGEECRLVRLEKTKTGWAGQSTCHVPGGRKLQVYGWLRGDLVTEYSVVGRVGEDGMVSDVQAKWSGPCPPGTPLGPDARTVFR